MRHSLHTFHLSCSLLRVELLTCRLPLIFGTSRYVSTAGSRLWLTVSLASGWQTTALLLKLSVSSRKANFEITFVFKWHVQSLLDTKLRPLKGLSWFFVLRTAVPASPNKNFLMKTSQLYPSHLSPVKHALHSVAVDWQSETRTVFTHAKISAVAQGNDLHLLQHSKKCLLAYSSFGLPSIKVPPNKTDLSPTSQFKCLNMRRGRFLALRENLEHLGFPSSPRKGSMCTHLLSFISYIVHQTSATSPREAPASWLLTTKTHKRDKRRQLVCISEPSSTAISKYGCTRTSPLPRPKKLPTLLQLRTQTAHPLPVYTKPIHRKQSSKLQSVPFSLASLTIIGNNLILNYFCPFSPLLLWDLLARWMSAGGVTAVRFTVNIIKKVS